LFSIKGERGRERLCLLDDVGLDQRYQLNEDLLQVQEEVMQHLFAPGSGSPGRMRLSQIGGLLSPRSHNCMLAYKLQLKTFIHMVSCFIVTCVDHGSDVVVYRDADDVPRGVPASSLPPTASRKHEVVASDESYFFAQMPSAGAAAEGKKRNKMSMYRGSLPTAFDHPDELGNAGEQSYVPFSPPSPVPFLMTLGESNFVPNSIPSPKRPFPFGYLEPNERGLGLFSFS
jgi:hypothetical protein